MRLWWRTAIVVASLSSSKFRRFCLLDTARGGEVVSMRQKRQSSMFLYDTHLRCSDDGSLRNRWPSRPAVM